MTMNKQELPVGWVETTLGEIAIYIQRGKSPKYIECSELPVINQKSVRWHGIEQQYVKYVHPEQWTSWAEERFLQHLDILWNSTGTGTIGRACLYKRDYFERAVVDSHVTILRLFKKYISPEYLFYFIMSPFIQKRIEEMQSGSTNQVELGRGGILETKIPLAPLPEQHRIVSKIEELFSDLDQGEAALRKVQTLLTRYRQAVLKAAVTGELTRDWREANRHRLEPGEVLLQRILQARRENWNGRGKYQEPQAPATSTLPDLPEGWVWVTVDALVIEPLKNGRSVPDAEHGFPVLRLTSVKNGKIDLSEYKCGRWTKDEAEDYLVCRGDFFVVRGNGSKNLVGRGALVVDDPNMVAFPDTLIRVRVNQNWCSMKYLALVWNSGQLRRQIETRARTTAGIYKINQQDIASFIFPLAPIQEQKEVEDRVEELFSQIDTLATWCKTELARSTTLRQAILKAAFSGQLVPQDPADEPASRLLERIRTERAARGNGTQPSGKPKRGGRGGAEQMELL